MSRIASRIWDVQNVPSGAWAVGAIANGYLLTGAGWVALNVGADPRGPWRPGDVVADHAYTGEAWVPLPAGWRADPTGRHQFRWWTGHYWSEHALTNGIRTIDPPTPSARSQATSPLLPAREPIGCAEVLGKVALVTYCGFWLLVALYAAGTAAEQG